MRERAGLTDVVGILRVADDVVLQARQDERDGERVVAAAGMLGLERGLGLRLVRAYLGVMVHGADRLGPDDGVVDADEPADGAAARGDRPAVVIDPPGEERDEKAVGIRVAARAAIRAHAARRAVA